MHFKALDEIFQIHIIIIEKFLSKIGINLVSILTNLLIIAMLRPLFQHISSRVRGPSKKYFEALNEIDFLNSYL